jgi:Helix-turn-helix of DDE superfamily endonuclease
MVILSYDDVKSKPATLSAMTGLIKAEFEELCVAFREAWDEYVTQEGMVPSKGGRKPKLKSMEDRLFFILFYLKTYPLQEVLGHLFGLSQGQANFWIHRLSLVLKKALKRKDSLPARLPDEMLVRLETEGSQDLSIDGTERRINRPNEDDRQREHYSGKKKPIPSRTT